MATVTNALNLTAAGRATSYGPGIDDEWLPYLIRSLSILSNLSVNDPKVWALARALRRKDGK